MRFQPRDQQILLDIYEHDGAMAKRHLKEKYWPDKTERAMEQRLAKLENADYIARPNWEQRRCKPIPEPVRWLKWRGALAVASYYGIKVNPPKSDNEYQLRSFQTKLRDAGLRGVREPRWIQLAHDLSVIDFKVAMEKSLKSFSNLHMQQWVPEGYFRSSLANRIKSPEGMMKPNNKKEILPDGYIEIIDTESMKRGDPHTARFLLEIDMATHDNISFGKEKILPGINYIQSPNYFNLTGSNKGHWLIATKGHEKRLANLMKQVEKHAWDDSELFFLTTFEQIGDSNLLTEPIWMQAGIDKPLALLD